MKKIAIMILVAFYFSCSSARKEIITTESSIDTAKITRIVIPENYENPIQSDSIFEEISVIPLETNKSCLLADISKIMIVDSCIYIQQDYNLFVFSVVSGMHIQEIGAKGKGPGEFLAIRDFDIDTDGNIYILDYMKILKYSSKGDFIEKYGFDFMTGNAILCNPMRFSLCGNDEFYIWGGSFGGIKDNKDNNLFLLYKLNKHGEITERYFPLKNREIEGRRNQFYKFGDHYNISPWFGTNIIYKADSTGISTNYIVDFGAKTMNEPVPHEFKDLGIFKAEMEQKYSTIRDIVETQEWLYLLFTNKQHFWEAYYSKKLKRTFVSDPRSSLKIYRIIPYLMHTEDKGDLIALINPDVIFDILSNIDNMSSEVKKIKKALKETTISDNPVILRCKMKKY